jgi:phosphatidylglycerophosphatase A
MTGARLIASWFGSGYLPGAPGSWGSLAALPFAWVITAYAGKSGLLVAAIALFAIGWFAADSAIENSAVKDPGWIVIDEVVGQWLTLLVLPLDLLAYATGFVVFRIFDIWKPWPIRAIERRSGGGFGIMIDDVAAALCAVVVIVIGRRVFER